MADTDWRLEFEFGGIKGTIVDPIRASVTRSGSLFGDTGTPRLSADLEVIFPFDVADMVFGRGVDPETGIGTLYADGERFIRARWSDVSFGREGEPVRLTLDAGELDDTQYIPGGRAVLESTLPSYALDAYKKRADEFALEAAESREGSKRARRFAELAGIFKANYAAGSRKAIGKTGAMVFGSPGTSDTPGFPAYNIDQTDDTVGLFLTSHALGKGAVRLFGPGTTGGAGTNTQASFQPLANATNDRDDLGNPRSRLVTAFTDASSNIVHDPDGDYYASLLTAEGLSPLGGDVCLLLLSLSSIPFDSGAWQAVKSRLDAYRFDFFIGERVRPYEYLSRQILPLLPVGLDMGPNGLRPALWPWLDEPNARTELIANRSTLTLAGGVRKLRLRAEPEIVIDYGYTPDGNRTTLAVGRTVATSAYAQAAAFRARSGTESIEARVLWDEVTANAIADDRHRATHLVPYAIPYMADPRVFGLQGTRPLRIGDTYMLTDPSLSLDRKAVSVGEIERDASSMRVTFYIRGDILRD